MSASTQSTFKPGQPIRCTITSQPRNAAATKTLVRLMRLDPSVVKGGRKGHRRRQQELNQYIRGNRLWTSRERCPQLVEVAKGQSWSMSYAPVLAADLASVASFIEIRPA